MYIYKFDSLCYNCAKPVTYYTYLIFREYEIDVLFPLDMKLVRLAYAEMPSHKDDPYFDVDSLALNFPIKILGDDEDLDLAVNRCGKFPNIKYTKSERAQKSYFANHCPYCDGFLGNYYLRQKVTDDFLKPNIPMDIFCEI